MEHLNGLQKPLQRNKILSIIALAKRAILDVINSFFNGRVIDVKIANKQDLGGLSNEATQALLKMQKNLRKIEYLLQAPPKVILPTLEINEVVKEVSKGLENLKLSVRLPKKQEITGNVRVSNQIDFPIERMEKALMSIENKIAKIKLSDKAPKIEFPSIPEGVSPKDIKKMLEALSDIKKELKELPSNMPEMDFPARVTVDNFPTPKYPNPVTNININSLRGVLQSRPITVETTVTAMPSDPIENRRAMIIYNNDATKTLYIGGSNVSTTNGFPIPPRTYSPPIDAGVKMIVYGITSSGTLNARILEISNENIGI